MKRTKTLFLQSICLIAFILLGTTAFTQQIAINAHNISVNTDFNGWNGTMPNGFERSANNNYMGTSPMINGGVYAIPNMGFGYQPSSNTSAQTTSVSGTFVNNTGSAITELKITYDAFKIVHRDSRNPCWTVNVSSGVFGTNLNWCSNESNATKTFTSPVSIAEGATFTISLNSERGSGSQSSPMIGFNNIKVESIKEACVTPDAPLVDPQFFCGGATVNDLFADGTDIKWYATADATTPLTLDTLLETGTYYATQTIDGCESNKVGVAIDITAAPTAPIAEAQTFCGPATVADLIPFGSGIGSFREDFNVDDHSTFIGAGNQGNIELGTGNWTFNNTGILDHKLNLNGFALTPVLTDVDSITFASNNPQNHIRIFHIVDGQEVNFRTIGLVGNQTHTFPSNINGAFQLRFESINPNSPINIDYIEFKGGEQTTINWYDSPTASTPLTPDTQLETGTYYVAQSSAIGCESPRTPVEITVNDIPTAPAAETQAFCGSATVADLIPSVATHRSESFDQETERAELPVGQHNFDLSWNVINRNVRHECGNSAYNGTGCAIRLYSHFLPLKGTIESPVLEGVQSVSFYAKKQTFDINTGPNILRVSKLVDGVETIVQDIDLTSVEDYVFYNVDVNENEDAKLIFSSHAGFVYMDDLQFNQAVVINWYDVATDGTPLSADTELTTGTYYVSKSRNGCESARTPVEITINDIPAAPVAEAQSFCGEASVADLVPTLSAGTAPLVEGFEVDVPGSISGNAPYDLGIWTTQNVGTTNEPGNSVSGYAARFKFFPTMISPEIDSIKTVTFYGKATADKTLNISKIVNGNESHLQTITLQAGDFQLYTVQVNELSENVKIKFVGQDTFPTAFIDNVTFYQTNSSDENISWYNSETSVEVLTAETILETGTYYVSQTINGCESLRTAVEVTINEIPTAPVAEAQDFCGNATVADLIAEGTNLVWYDSIDSTTALTDETELISGSYFVEQSVNDCVSERTEVVVTVNEIPTAPIAEAQEFCGTATVADLIAEGTNLVWYDSIDSTTALTDETELISGSYFVEQSVNDCVSERTEVVVTINEILDAPEAQDQAFCGTATVADLVAEGTNLAWYATENSTVELTPETELTSGTYYVSQSSETCESVRIPIEVTINEIPNAPLAFTLQEFEPGATLADLDVEGENLTWYDEEGNVLDPSTPLVDGEVYYVSQTVNGCESDTIGIETQALSITESDFANFNLYPNPVKNLLHISNTKQIDQVLVFSLSGQLILEKKANAKSLELNLSHLASATYVVKIVSNNQIKTVTVIKK